MEELNFNPDGVGVANGSYFSMPYSIEKARLVLLPVPWDVTVSYGAGTVEGPEAILEASSQLDFHDPMTQDAWREGIATLPFSHQIKQKSQSLRQVAEEIISSLEEGKSIEEAGLKTKLDAVNEGCRWMNHTTEQAAEQALKDGHLVGLIGGDHSTPYGLIKALGAHHEQFGILHIDAHCDLRLAYEGFDYSHASIMRNVLRNVPQVTRLTQVAIRDFCSEEAQLTQNDPRIRLYDDWTLAENEFQGRTWDSMCEEIVESLPEKVYVSFDIDGLCSENCPHTGTPVPGGLSFNKAVRLLQMLCLHHKHIIGFDVVEVAPSPLKQEKLDEIVGARILWRLCSLCLLSDREFRE